MSTDYHFCCQPLFTFAVNCFSLLLSIAFLLCCQPLFSFAVHRFSLLLSTAFHFLLSTAFHFCCQPLFTFAVNRFAANSFDLAVAWWLVLLCCWILMVILTRRVDVLCILRSCWMTNRYGRCIAGGWWGVVMCCRLMVDGSWWLFRLNSGTAFLVEVSGHKHESSQTRVFVWFSTIMFPFYKTLFMTRVFLFRGLFCKDF